MRVLHLTLKKKWFDMIASGEKKEEYREIKEYWCNRFCFNNWKQQYLETLEKTIKADYDIVRFKNGYSKNAAIIDVEYKGMYIGNGKEDWGGSSSHVFVIKLGELLTDKQ